MKDTLRFNYKGFEFTLNREFRSIVSRQYPDLLKKYELKSARSTEGGDIVRKHAWDSIAGELERAGKIEVVFEEILKRTEGES